MSEFDSRLRLLLITPEDLGESELYARTKDALAGGVRALQLRCKSWSGAAIYRIAERLRRLTADFDAVFLVNGRVDVALAVRADGVHAGDWELPHDIIRRLTNETETRLLGYSAHAESSILPEPDYVVYSPVYASPGKGAPLGTASLKQAVAVWANRPVLALGGVERKNFAELARCGAAGVALIRAIYEAADIGVEAAACMAEIEEQWNGAKNYH